MFVSYEISCFDGLKYCEIKIQYTKQFLLLLFKILWDKFNIQKRFCYYYYYYWKYYELNSIHKNDFVIIIENIMR
jgi:hypothetical protein